MNENHTRLPVRFFPMAGVIVFAGETDDEAFARAEREAATARARETWHAAERALAAAHADLPWWEPYLPDGRS